MKKEQSSNSTPKIKYALKEKYDEENKETKVLKKKLKKLDKLKNKDPFIYK